MNARFDNFEQVRRIRSWYAAYQRQPSWVVKFAGIAAALMIIVPVALLVLMAVVTFIVVFAVLGLAHRIGTAVRNLFDRQQQATWPDDGRRGVRVITAEFRPNE